MLKRVLEVGAKNIFKSCLIRDRGTRSRIRRLLWTTYIHIYIYIYTHTHIMIYIYIYTHTYTYINVGNPAFKVFKEIATQMEQDQAQDMCCDWFLQRLQQRGHTSDLALHCFWWRLSVGLVVWQ